MKLKLFEQFVNESKETSLSQSVLTALNPTIITMVADIKKWIEEDYKKKNKGEELKLTEFEVEMIRLQLIADMLKSFEKYTDPSDKLVTIRASRGRKGIEIMAVIERNGETYDYYTEAIAAGGYNIQSFHYRYLTKTKLRSSARQSDPLSLKYIQELKKMTKVEKINYEIKNFERTIEDINAKLTKFANITDEEISKILTDEGDWSHDRVSWEEIVKRGADRNYDYSEELYMKREEENRKHGREHWRVLNIESPARRKVSLEKEITKLKSKLAALM